MSILDSLKEALDQRSSLKVNQFGDYTSHELKIMVALLVVSAANADGFVHRDERLSMMQLLERQFDFTDEQAAQVIDVAEFLLDKDHKITEFADQILHNFKESQRVTLLAMYIKILEADGVVTTEEMQGLEKMLGLLHLERDMIDKAKDQLKLGEI